MKKPNYIFKPFPKQARFLSCPAFEVLFGGAAGPGKSLSLLIDPLVSMQQGKDGKPVENYHALILRRKFTDLEKSLIFESHKYYKGRAVFDGQARRWKFPGNCSVTFGHCQYDRDMYNYESAQYQEIAIDELTDFTEKMYLFFMTRIRTTHPNHRTKIRGATNPGGIGHAWVKKRFWIDEDSRPPDRMYDVSQEIKHPDGKTETLTYKRAYIPATVYDNPFILENNRQYLAQLMEQPEAHRRAYLEGRWDMFEGQFFTEWNPALHVCKEFAIPRHWRRSISFDWGYNDPTCVLWFAEDPDTGIVYCYRELYVNKTIDVEVARQIKELTGSEEIHAIYYPWDLDNSNPQTGVSMKERMQGLIGNEWWWKQANKDRTNGWAACRRLLSKREDGRARMQIFEGCRNLIRTLPEQVFNTRGETKVEDLDTLGDDHACFVAGTQVLTETGMRNIEDIRSGDRVLTREGYREVVAGGMTSHAAEVCELTTSAGTLIGTLNHPVFMADGSKKKLGDLKPGDTLFDARFITWKSKFLTKLARNLTESVITSAGNISKETGLGCIAPYGHIITEKSPLASTFTTKTLIAQTINSRTSNYCAVKSTFRSIPVVPKSGSVHGETCFPSSTPPLQDGTDRRRGANFINGSGSNRGARKSISKRIASFVEGNILRLGLRVLGGVISIAKWLTFAPPVKVLGLRPLSTRQPVFNLSVNEHHEYFANGLLVSNCDAWRYFAATFRAMPEIMKEQRGEPVFDLGGATKKGKTFYLKKEEPRMAFNWMVE